MSVWARLTYEVVEHWRGQWHPTPLTLFELLDFSSMFALFLGRFFDERLSRFSPSLSSRIVSVGLGPSGVFILDRDGEKLDQALIFMFWVQVIASDSSECP